MPHHTECWQENGGCTTYGCSGTTSYSAVGHIPSPVARPHTPVLPESTSPVGPVTLAILLIVYLLVVMTSICSTPREYQTHTESSHSSHWRNDSYDSEDEYAYEVDESKSDLDEDDTGYLEEDTEIESDAGYLEEDTATDGDDTEYDESDSDEFEDDWDEEYEDDGGGY